MPDTMTPDPAGEPLEAPTPTEIAPEEEKRFLGDCYLQSEGAGKPTRTFPVNPDSECRLQNHIDRLVTLAVGLMASGLYINSNARIHTDDLVRDACELLEFIEKDARTTFFGLDGEGKAKEPSA